jgi:hypothetical protein
MLEKKTRGHVPVARRSFAALLLAGAACTCALAGCGETSGGASDASTGEDQGAGSSVLAEAEAELTASYARPELHRVTPQQTKNERPDLMVWTRTYDDVPMLNRAKSVLIDGRWQVRSRRELREPAPVNKAAVISTERAAESAGLASELAAGAVLTRLVHDPNYEQLARVPEPQNAEDVEEVIAGYRLAWELTETNEDRTYVDAYAGDVLRRESSAVHVAVTAPGALYGSQVPLDLVPFSTSYSLRDATRFTRYVDGEQFNGVGVLPGITDDTDIALAYALISKVGWQIDAHFALAQAWDYYDLLFRRKGLKGQPGSANDPVIAWDPSGPRNAFMRASLGLITLSGPNPEHFSTLETIGHEFAHAVFAQDTDNPLNPHYIGEHGGINEAHSDIVGELVQARGMAVLNAPGTRPGFVEIQGWFKGDEVSALLMRNLCNQSLDGHSINEWQPGLGKTDPHYTSGALNRMSCLLTQGVKPLSVNDPLLSTPLVPDGFTGLGSGAVGQLWTIMLPYLATASEPYTFFDARDAMLSSATLLHGKHSPPYKAVQDAFAAVRVGAIADRTPPTVGLPKTVLGKGKPFTVTATDLHGVKSVDCKLDGVPLVPSGIPAIPGGPDWICVTPQAVTSGAHSLSITAEDTELNKVTKTFSVTVDGNPPALGIIDESPVTPEYRLKKLYKVIASDPNGVESLSLLADGAPPAFASGSSATFTVNYTGGGSKLVRASATDSLGNVAHYDDYFVVDTIAPEIVSITKTESTVNSGSCTFTVCALDTAGLGVQRLQLDGPTGPYATDGGLDPVTLCRRFQRTLSLGAHTAEAQFEDKWGNLAKRTVSFTVNGVAPSISSVTAEPTMLGNGGGGEVPGVYVFAHYTIAEGFHAVRGELELCDPTCTLVETDLAPGPTHTLFGTRNVTPGKTYTARATITDNQGLSAQGTKVFTMPSGPPPPPADVVFSEIEANNSFAGANSVASTFNVIRGTQPAGFISEDDFFKIAVPAGKQICIAAAKTTSSTCPAFLAFSNVDPSSGVPFLFSWTDFQASRAAIESGDFVCTSAQAGFVWLQRGIDISTQSCATTLGYDIVFKYQ